jgi:hypothetical protein
MNGYNYNPYGQPMGPQQGQQGYPNQQAQRANIYQNMRQQYQQPQQGYQQQFGGYQQPMGPQPQFGGYQQPMGPQPQFGGYQQPMGPQPMPGFGFQQPRPMGTVPPMMGAAGLQQPTGFGQPMQQCASPTAAPNVMSGYNQPQQTQVKQQQKQEPDRSNYKPLPGNEFLPLYDEEKEILRIIFDDVNKTYKYVIEKKVNQN